MLCSSGLVYAQIDSNKIWHEQNILNATKHFIALVKNNQRTQLANLAHYSLRREYPIPNVTSKADFLKRFDEIFDDSLIRMISSSDPAKDWGEVGWRGIMFLNGQVWIDEDAQLIAVNYESHAEKQKREQLVEAERKTLHPSIRKYKSPVCILKTSKYLIRIDELPGYKYRYTSWPINGKLSDPPSLNLIGELEFEGNAGNRSYLFKNNGYNYTCSIIVIGEDDSPPAALTITKGDKEILYQRAILVGN